jgi:hypothetical protein
MESFNYHVLHSYFHHIDITNYCIYSANIVANHRSELRGIYGASNLYNLAALFVDLWTTLRDCFYFADYARRHSNCNHEYQF